MKSEPRLEVGFKQMPFREPPVTTVGAVLVYISCDLRVELCWNERAPFIMKDGKVYQNAL
jgi:hypothetical protein